MVVLLALLAALLFAMAGAAEQRAAAQVLRAPAAVAQAAEACAAAWRQLGLARRLRLRARQGLRQAVGLVRSPLWIAGWAADGLGFATQAGAVHFGSLSVVQPLLVTTLLFSLPLAALGGRRRPRWPDWAGAAAACAGLALVLSGRRPAATAGALAGTVHETRLLAMAMLVLAGAGALVLVARARPGRGQAVPLSVAAGMMFALTAAFTKLVGDSLASRGVAGTIGFWPAYALAGVALAGLVLQQLAFSAGSLPATMTAMTLTDPLVSYALGVGGFGEHAPHGAAAVALAVAGVGLLGAGIAVLARSPLLRRQAQPVTSQPIAARPVPARQVTARHVPAPAARHAACKRDACGPAVALPVTPP